MDIPASSSTSFLELNRCKFIPLPLTSICACQSSHRPSKKTLILTRPSLKLRLCVDGSRGFVHIPPRGRFGSHQRIITRVARAERDYIEDGEPKEMLKLYDRTKPIHFSNRRWGRSWQSRLHTKLLQFPTAPKSMYETLESNGIMEVNKGFSLSLKQDSAAMQQQNTSQLTKRVVFGLGIGISAGGVVLIGGWVFAVALTAAVFAGAREYFELVRSRGIAAGMTPPPRYVSRVCSVICTLMPIITLYVGQIDVSVTSAAFVVAMALLLQRGNPRFAQLSSAMFGLFYCGYLPCFWVKLRCGLAAPALNTRVGAAWPVLFGGQAHWTVGLVATLISISSIIAADTFAFVGGKAFGRTPLTNISPKKTWEGALAGLTGCIATSVILAKIFSWPTSVLSAVAFGFLNFFGSLFGDLTESMIKRDAGVKDSGSLIPGHGGILDRVDSYLFTGALAYAFVKNLLPLYGV